MILFIIYFFVLKFIDIQLEEAKQSSQPVRSEAKTFAVPPYSENDFHEADLEQAKLLK